MPPFVMSLERRVLFATVGASLVSDLQQTAQDASSIASDVSQCIFQTRGDYQSIAGDLRGQVHTAAQRKLLAAATTAGRQLSAGILHGYFGVIRAGLADGHAAALDGTRVVNGATNPNLPNRLLRELTRVQTKTAAPLAAFLAALPNAAAAFSNSLAPLAAAFPSNDLLQSDVQAATTNAGDCVSTIPADAATAQADLSLLISDLTS